MSEFDTKRALAAIRPEIVRAAIALEKKRRARREAMAFALAACAFLAACYLAFVMEAWWIAPAGGMGLTLAFAPFLTYFEEGGKTNES